MYWSFFTGVAIGIVSAIIPLYLSECAPKHIRGRIVALYTMMLTFGQFVASVVSSIIVYYKISGESNGWRWMLGFAVIPPLIQGFLLFNLPESPRWLITKDETDEAVEVLTRLITVLMLKEM
eukprot:UN34772